ncbi:MAG: superoxide dismutase [Ni] [Phycisphaerae bacterium]|jgi:nickel superoxide dismutase
MKRYFFMAGGSLVGLALMATLALWIAEPNAASAHCQVPCGIYDDQARINRLHEDATTIAKAIDNIKQLAASHDAKAFNQATRWINTKEAHASHIIEVVSQYFLTQKVKPVSAGADGYDAYLKKLADHHAVMVAAMKTKQNVDPVFAQRLEQAIDALANHYK